MLNVDISVLHFKPIDSSNVTPALWIELARLIRDSYASFDGFVVLHGTDTMAYSASALSFMIENWASRSSSRAVRFRSACCGPTGGRT